MPVSDNSVWSEGKQGRDPCKVGLIDGGSEHTMADPTPKASGSGPPAPPTTVTGSSTVASSAQLQNSLTSLLSASWSILMPQIGELIRQQVSEALQGAGAGLGKTHVKFNT